MLTGIVRNIASAGEVMSSFGKRAPRLATFGQREVVFFPEINDEPAPRDSHD
jgi:hypothetical protein